MVTLSYVETFILFGVWIYAMVRLYDAGYDAGSLDTLDDLEAETALIIEELKKQNNEEDK